MRSAFRNGAFQRGLQVILIAFFATHRIRRRRRPRRTKLDDLVSAVVRIKTFINPDGTSVSNLGREREGSGIVIDESGLVLTIGYLMVEAHAAEIVTNAGRTLPATVVGYDHETGFGLLRTLEPPKIKPLTFGKLGGAQGAGPGAGGELRRRRHGAAGPRREPPRVHRKLGVSGRGRDLHEPAASGLERGRADQPRGQADRRRLADRRRRQRRQRSRAPATCSCRSICSDRSSAISSPRAAWPGAGRPWLGVNAQAMHGRLFVGRVAPGSPAEQAGLKRGDIIAGVNGEKTRTLSELYRKVWALGAAGVTVPLDVLSDSEPRRVEVNSVNRLDTLKLQSTF